MTPRFVCNSRMDYSACCGIARRRWRRHPAAAAITVSLLIVLALAGGFTLIGALLRARMGQSVFAMLLGRGLLLGLSFYLLLWGIPRLYGLVLLRRCRIGHNTRQRILVYEDGIDDGTLPEDVLPYSFARCSRFSEDSHRFYLLLDDRDLIFDKHGFTTGSPDAFRLFLRQELRALTLTDTDT